MLQARMKNPAMVVPGALQSLRDLAQSSQSVLPSKLYDLLHMRASQINGCAVCLHMHARQGEHNGETPERMATLAAWRDSPFFTDAERAALGLAEAVTRLSDRSDPVPDEVWQEAARHYNEQELGAIVLAIATTNVWNRLNVATRQVAGEGW